MFSLRTPSSILLTSVAFLGHNNSTITQQHKNLEPSSTRVQQPSSTTTQQQNNTMALQHYSTRAQEPMNTIAQEHLNTGVVSAICLRCVRSFESTMPRRGAHIGRLPRSESDDKVELICLHYYWHFLVCLSLFQNEVTANAIADKRLILFCLHSPNMGNRKQRSPCDTSPLAFLCSANIKLCTFQGSGNSSCVQVQNQ